MKMATIEGTLKEVNFIEEGSLQDGVLAVVTTERVFGPKDRAYHSRINIDRGKHGKASIDVIGIVSPSNVGKRVTYITDHARLINKSIITEELYIEKELLLDYVIIKK